MAVAVVLTLVDVLWHSWGREGAEVSLRVLVAGLVGGLGGFAGGLAGQLLYATTQLSVFLILGWTITGVLIGVAPGLYDLLARLARDEDATGARKKVVNGLLGGSLGGLVGGAVFLLVGGFWSLVFSGRSAEFWSPAATGFVALGLCIGLLIGLAQVILKTAWITVVSGFRAGRELLLSRGEMVIGRAEGCDIPLFGDAFVEKQHARIVMEDGRYLLEDLDSPGGTYLNGRPVTRPTPLHAGDLIEVGRSSLRFGERVRRVQSA
jgi:MFS family permease